MATVYSSDISKEMLPTHFFHDNNEDDKYIEANKKKTGNLDALQSQIKMAMKSKPTITSFETNQPDITDPGLQFFVLFSPENVPNPFLTHRIYTLDRENIIKKQYILSNSTYKKSGVLFTYKDGKQLAVNMNQLYYETAPPLVAASKAKASSSIEIACDATITALSDTASRTLYR